MQTHVVTGATGGIGRAIVEALARRGDRVVLVARDPARGTALCGDLVHLTGNPAIELVTADLADPRSVEEAGRALVHRLDRIDTLIHAAGLWPSRKELGPTGMERAFAVNHLAPFLLDQLLTDRLVEARARVVHVSAGIAVKGRVDLERTPTGDDWHPLRTYSGTKLWDLVAALERARRLAGTGVTVNAVHPGVIRTGLGDRPGLLGWLLRLVKRTWSTPTEGAEAPLLLATDPALAAVTGAWFDRKTRTELPSALTDPTLGAAVWERTEALLRT